MTISNINKIKIIMSFRHTCEKIRYMFKGHFHMKDEKLRDLSKVDKNNLIVV